jgi:hypothetical protein
LKWLKKVFSSRKHPFNECRQIVCTWLKRKT